MANECQYALQVEDVQRSTRVKDDRVDLVDRTRSLSKVLRAVKKCKGLPRVTASLDGVKRDPVFVPQQYGPHNHQHARKLGQNGPQDEWHGLRQFVSDNPKRTPGVRTRIASTGKKTKGKR